MRPPELSRELSTAQLAATEAGEIIRRYYEGSVEIGAKGRDNPVTTADLEANRRLSQIIRGAFPQDGWLSEETEDSRERLSRARIWVVDPLDGTKEFIGRLPEFCVCVALVVEGTPEVAVSYNPITRELFHARRGAGAFLDGRPIRVSGRTSLKDATVLASRSEDKRGEWEEFKPKFRVELTGSVAFKLALVAAGRADATFTLTPKNEWDVCSGCLLVTEAGGRVSGLTGEQVVFNRPDTLLPGLVASNGALHEGLLQLLRGRRPARSSGGYD